MLFRSPFMDGLESERMGWCDWRNLLICPPDPNWLMQDRYAIFGLRIDTRKVPPALAKAHLDLKLQELATAKDLTMISKEARTSLKDEVDAELLAKVLPTPKVIEVAWDLKNGMLLTTAGGGKAQSALVELFIKSFGCELQALVPLPLAGRVAPELSTEGLVSSEPMDFELEENA